MRGTEEAFVKALLRAKKSTCFKQVLFGGDKRDRTADLLTASQALSQYKRVANPLKGVGRVLLVRRIYELILQEFHFLKNSLSNLKLPWKDYRVFAPENGL